MDQDLLDGGLGPALVGTDYNLIGLVVETSFQSAIARLADNMTVGNEHALTIVLEL